MRFSSFIISIIISVQLFAQAGSKRMSRAEYITKFKADAIEEMQRTGIPASITLAQGILESADGNSPLARYANNHFGIKCHSDWHGATFIQDDDKKDECFRKYKKALESYKDHSAFLTNRGRYSFLFDLKVTDYKGWARGLKKAGYATNPKYPKLLIGIIEDNQLYKLDDPSAQHAEKKQLATKKRHHHTNKKHNSSSNNPFNSATGKHQVKTHENHIKYIVAQEGDLLEDIADEFNMGLWQLLKYNDVGEDYQPKAGDIIFLQPKRGRGQQDYYIAKAGESLYNISQKTGVKLKSLYRKNRITAGYQPKVGERIYLRKSKPR